MEVFFFMTDFEIEIDRFMLDCAAKGLTAKTMKSYEQTLKLYAKWMFDEFEIDSPKIVKAEHLRSYMRSLSERGKYEMTVNDKANNNPKAREDFGKKISNSTISNYTRNIKVFFAYLYQEQVIRTNPMKNVKNVKPERKMKVMLEDNQLKQFFKAFDVTKFEQYRDWIIARLIFDTGSRIGELLDIVPSDIDLRANALLLRNTKNKKQRFVYFSDKTRRNLKSWLDYKDRYSNSDYVFPTIHGTKVKVEGVERSFRLRSKDVGLEISPHLLRNNFAKRYLINGGDLATLSRLLGHASVEITAQIYLDFADKEVMRKYQRHSPLNNLDV